MSGYHDCLKSEQCDGAQVDITMANGAFSNYYCHTMHSYAWLMVDGFLVGFGWGTVGFL